MPERSVIRPSMKGPVTWWILICVFLAAAAYGTYGYLEKPALVWHALGLVLLLIPLKKTIATRGLSLTIDADHLTYESGLLSRMRRTVDLGKVQDVTARQSFGERMVGLGDLMVETAGERSAIVIEGIDRPQEVADLILERSRELSRMRTGTPMRMPGDDAGLPKK
jgi:membrane protein YdbS with pleckstrin-like domain